VRENIRLAATVMLIRDTPQGMEVYMVQRPGRGDFPDLHVFPGGKVDADDFTPEICFGIDDLEASRRLGVTAGGLRYWVAVARECFEECGILLLHRDGNLLDFSDLQLRQRFAAYRSRLLAGGLSFAAMCRQEELQVACDLLGYFSHWLTPSSAPRRFDTRFFLAALPPGQRTLADTDETADDQWEFPQEALMRHRQREWQMIDPTLRSLETLSQFGSVEAALEGVRQGNHLMPLTPQLQNQGMQPLRG
jgi:8-oxo-dGTP pyrophosphatase MutT (NUDIX family)